MVHRDIIVSPPPVTVHPIVFGYEQGRPLHLCGPKVRTHWLLHYVTKGKGYFTVGGKTHEVAAGCIFGIALDATGHARQQFRELIERLQAQLHIIITEQIHGI